MMNRRLMVLLGLAMSPVVVLAQGAVNDTLRANGLNLGDPEFEATLREKYVRSSALPDAVAFRELLGTLSGLNDQKPSLALSMVRNRMELSEEESSVFLGTVLELNAELSRDASLASRNELCAQGIPKVAGQQVYAALDAADDAEEGIASAHLTSLRKELNWEQVGRLDSWIESTKENTIYMKFDHKKRFEQQEIDPDATVAMLCGT